MPDLHGLAKMAEERAEALKKVDENEGMAIDVLREKLSKEIISNMLERYILVPKDAEWQVIYWPETRTKKYAISEEEYERILKKE